MERRPHFRLVGSIVWVSDSGRYRFSGSKVEIFERGAWRAAQGSEAPQGLSELISQLVEDYQTCATSS